MSAPGARRPAPPPLSDPDPVPPPVGDPPTAPAVELLRRRDAWAEEFARLAVRLARALGSAALRIDHIGSTSVTGLRAKDVVDVQVIVFSLEDEAGLREAFSAIGFAPRLNALNRRDHIPAWWRGEPSAWDKLVFGPGPDERPSNVHVRARGSVNERYALLFRDYLRADERARDGWGAFKRRAAESAGGLEAYGQLKDPATDVLLLAAERWAERTGWSTPSGEGAG